MPPKYAKAEIRNAMIYFVNSEMHGRMHAGMYWTSVCKIYKWKRRS